jgi:signal transduction histidine kinase
VVVDVLLVVVALASMLVATAYSSIPYPDDTARTLWAFAGMVAGVGVASLVLVRHRYPVVLAVVGSLYALALPGDAFVALVGLASVVASRPRAQALRVGALVVVATAVAVLRDALRPAAGQVASVRTPEGDVAAAPAWVHVVILVVAVGAAVGTGLFWRTRQDLSEARAVHQEQAQTTEHLRTELTRQEERDLIAREVHDTLAHRLSLVSLQAGALEVQAAGDPQMEEAASAVQANAHRSLEDLRGLIGVLRDPGAARSLAPETPAQLSLDDLAELLTSTREAGTPVVATVVVNDAATASAPFTHAVYRIVQESLTNAGKHAPGLPLDVALTASAASGLHLVVSNPLTTAQTTLPGARAGITGIHERVRLLGGRAEVGPRDGRFVVDVWLPWSVGGG